MMQITMFEVLHCNVYFVIILEPAFELEESCLFLTNGLAAD